MAKYFHISAGLRGAYCDGAESAFILKADTRRDLKAAIASEVESWTDAGYIGGNKRAIATIAADAWREAHKAKPAYLPFALPLAPSHARDNYCFGIFVATSSRSDYLEYLEQGE